MAKVIVDDRQIYLSPNYVGYRNTSGNPEARNEKTGNTLALRNIDTKILVYEDQVKGWFLDRATRYLRGGKNDFIVLMVCMAYIEGVENMRKGQNDGRNSSVKFLDSCKRIFQNQLQDQEYRYMYADARCGLFHAGMVDGKILLSRDYGNHLQSDNGRILINPVKLLKHLKLDFSAYVKALKNEENEQMRDNFDRNYANYA